MPPLETADLHQKVVLYEKSGAPDRFGESKVKAAVEIDARWELVQRTITGPNGNPLAIDSVAVVDQDIPLGSLLWLGKKADLPSPVTNLREVVAKEETPDLKNRFTYREVLLRRYRDSLPDITS